MCGPVSDAQAIATAIREALARRRLSRRWLADEARISLSTLEKALAGERPFSLTTLVRLEQVLGVTLRGEAQAIAPAELGSYARSAVSWLEGDFLALRPSLEDAGAIYAYRITIAWDDAASHLIFAESDRLDRRHAQRGAVAIPASSGHVYLHTNSGGQMRLAILSRPEAGGEMFGVMLTMAAGPALTPTAFALALVPLPEGVQFGQSRAGDAKYDAHRDLLARAKDYARLSAYP
jgi:transcriptional regulator with XRE-family HTH domain